MLKSALSLRDHVLELASVACQLHAVTSADDFYAVNIALIINPTRFLLRLLSIELS